jgi:hypothetical protein
MPPQYGGQKPGPAELASALAEYAVKFSWDIYWDRLGNVFFAAIEGGKGRVVEGESSPNPSLIAINDHQHHHLSPAEVLSAPQSGQSLLRGPQRPTVPKHSVGPPL